MILIGKNKQDFIGNNKKILALSVLQIGIKAIVMSSWVPRKGSVLLH